MSVSTSAAPVVEVDEPVYSFEPADNGANPFWCQGSTALVRVGERVFLSGLETLTAHEPLHNVRWLLFARSDEGGWRCVARDERDRTREPCPLGVFPPDRLWLSANPTLTEPGTARGPAQPRLLGFDVNDVGGAPEVLTPRWSEDVTFNEHSYRSFAVDGPGRELLLMHNRDYDRAYWSLLDRAGVWSASGKLTWPVGTPQDASTPLRLCYPNVALCGRAVHFLGVSDIKEPNPAWREAKLRITGREWDYDFRRLFYTWTPDVTREPFSPWVEVASRDATAGHARNRDLHVDASGEAHLLWIEASLDPRLRDEFFPGEPYVFQLRYARMRDGVVRARTTLLEVSGDDDGRPEIEYARFHITPGQRVMVVYSLARGDDDARSVRMHLAELDTGAGRLGPTVALPLEHGLTGPFFTATPRAGSEPSPWLDLAGLSPEAPRTVRYVRVRVGD